MSISKDMRAADGHVPSPSHLSVTLVLKGKRNRGVHYLRDQRKIESSEAGGRLSIKFPKVHINKGKII